MLRLSQVRTVRGPYNPTTGQNDPAILEVTFAGTAGEFAEASVTLFMRPRPDDAQLLADALPYLSKAIDALHREHCVKQGEL
jgi:hypothetical protein